MSIVVEVLFYLVLGIIITQSIFYQRLEINWPLILIAIALNSIYFFSWSGLIFLIITAIISTVAELISLKSRWNVFGVKYKYNLKDKTFTSHIVIGGVYPLEVTAAWILLKYLAFLLISLVTLRFGINQFFKVIICAFALVSFDLLIDPVAVKEGVWKWSKQGYFFGIPFRNFIGWFLVGIIISSIFIKLIPSSTSNVFMSLPVLLIWALFPISLGGKLIKRDKVKGIMVIIPSLVFLFLGILSVI